MIAQQNKDDHFEWDSEEEASNKELKDVGSALLIVFGTMIGLILSEVLLMASDFV